jgi:hypothetical protein
MSWPNATGDSETQGEGALVSRTLTVDTRQHRIVADTGLTPLCRNRVAEDGPMYALPMISVDGQEFAALPQLPVKGQATMRIYGFGESGQACEPHTAFHFSSGKTIFGFPGQGTAPRPADLAYEYHGQIWWFHRGQSMGSTGDAGDGQRFNIAPYEADSRVQWIASSFPGITRDGRVIYAATRKECPPNGSSTCTERVGYITADPYQSHAYRNHLQDHPDIPAHACITPADVQRERGAFARMHGLPSDK